MATITLSATVGATTITQTRNLSDADANRLIAWAKAQYGISLTNAQAFNAMAVGVFMGLRDNVLNYERESAASSAVGGVSDISIS